MVIIIVPGGWCFTGVGNTKWDEANGAWKGNYLSGIIPNTVTPRHR